MDKFKQMWDAFNDWLLTENFALTLISQINKSWFIQYKYPWVIKSESKYDKCFISGRKSVGLNRCLQEVYETFTITGSMVEVAMTGTALPVLLSISPSYKFNFGECPVGEHADVLCTIKNESNVLPAIFQFRKIAHFLTHPPNGKIPPGQSQDVIFSFSPNQIGMSQLTFQ